MTSADTPPADTTRQIALAHDALQTVRHCPEHAPAWWRLIGRLTPLPQEHAASMTHLVSQVSAGSALGQWLKHSALWRLSEDAVHLVAMAQVAPRLPDPDRWMALAVLVWHHALSRSSDRTAFRQLFLDTRQAELMETLGRGLPQARRPAGPHGLRHGVRRVAVVASHLSVARHGGTDMVFDLRAALESGGIDTHVFTAQELNLPTMSSYLAGANKSAAAAAQPSSWKLRTQGTVKVSLGDAEFSVATRWAQLTTMIDGYNPDVVLFVGLTSPVLWSLHRAYPVVGMSLHTLPPLAPGDVWLAADENAGAQAFWADLPVPLAVHFPFRFWPADAAPAGVRDIPGVPRDAVLLMSSGHRLHAEMRPAWTAGVRAFLDQHPHAHWALVGLDEKYEAALAQQHPRIHCLAHQDDLAACLRMADIYLNPPRMGGGASVAMAMSLGLPVLSMSGSDGGDKVGDMAVDDTNVYMQRLAEWVASAGLRQQTGAALQCRFRDELDISRPEASHRLIQACHEAIACFERRQTGAQTQTHHAE